MISDWDEIKRLAADFQKVQLSSTLQKLSERNCIEVVSLLVDKGLLEIIYTNDGKEYLTPEHLTNEVKDELHINGGRVNLTELARTLNVDFTKVTHVANKIAYGSKKIHLILGQLINDDYIQRLASEVNEKLIQNGEISVSDLAVQYDLPADFILQRVIEKYLGKTIHAKRDSSNPKVFFTQTYISRCKAKIRGALAGLTKPTPVSAILSQCKLHEKIFNSLIDELSTAGNITSKIAGAQYIPHIYTKTQNEWVTVFYKQNGYIEYDSVKKLKISDPKSFIQRQLANEKLTHLIKCAVGVQIIEQIESALEECISTGGYLDVSTLLPSVLSQEDIELLISIVISNTNSKSTILFGTTILTHQFLDQLIKPCEEFAIENAKKSVESGKYQQYIAEKQVSGNKHLEHEIAIGDHKIDKREERRKKAATGKGGGGTQGRETKTKSTKKHNRGDKGGFESDSDEEQVSNKKKNGQQTLELITIQDIIKKITGILESEGLDDLTKQIATHIYPQLCKLALTTAQTLFEASLQNSLQNRRQTHAALQEKLNNLLVDVRLYEKGLKLFGHNIQQQLIKYLLKSVGMEICNEIFFYVVNECGLNCNGTNLTNEQRLKIIQECGQEYKNGLTALNKSLAGTSVDEFLAAAENALQACSMIIKKIDKKKDRTLILCHKHGLLEQLTNCNDPALVLHLVVLIVFTIVTQNMLNASGRHVSAILSYLQPHLSPENAQLLTNFHDLVLKVLSAESAESDETKEILKQLDELIPKVKDVANNYKKITTTGSE